MTESETRTDANNCFVCGPDNAQGMHIKFRLENDVCIGEFTPPAHLCGFDGVTHGGVIFSLLDDVMANCLFLQGERAYTGKCEIRYREPVKTGLPLRLEGRLIKRRGRLADLAGQVLSAEDGRVLAEATARFITLTGNEI